MKQVWIRYGNTLLNLSTTRAITWTKESTVEQHGPDDFSKGPDAWAIRADGAKIGECETDEHVEAFIGVIAQQLTGSGATVLY